MSLEYVYKAATKTFLILGFSLACLPSFADIASSKIPCNSSQNSKVDEAKEAARKGISAAIDELNSSSQASLDRFQRWFGAPSSSNVAEVKDVFKKSLSAVTFSEYWCPIANSNELGFNTNDLAVAYPPDAPTAYYFAPAFFDLQSVGADSQGGTILHELTHLAAVKNTEDHAYGIAKVEALAKSNPTQARNNADSYQYYMEDVLYGI